MKLSNAQQKVISAAQADIDLARQNEYREWFMITQASSTRNVEEKINEGYLKEYWEQKRKAIVLTHCSSKTLAKLEEYGLIKIIKDSNGQNYGIDVIQLLNY